MSFDETVDFVVIGSGAGSVCAALWQQQAGKTAVILEKTDAFGGSTALSGGAIWAPNNMLMRREGVPDSEEQALAYLESTVGDAGLATTRARKLAFLTGINGALEFLESKGMPFFRPEGYADYYNERPGGNARGRTVMTKAYDLRELGDKAGLVRNRGVLPAPMQTFEGAQAAFVKTNWSGRRTALKVAFRTIVNKLTGRKWVGMGLSIQARLLKIALDHKLDVRLSAPVTDLIEEGGRVTGVVAQIGGRSVRIGARDGVLINAGGFSHNLAMRERYQPTPASVSWTSANPGDTGEMIETAMRLGAAVDFMDEAVWNSASTMPNGMLGAHVVDIARPHAILVDQTGQRFCNESGSYMETGQKQYERHKVVPAVPAWLVIDAANRRSYPFFVTMPGQTPQDWIDSGYLKKADTIEDLAAQCGMEPAVLKATVTRFNGFARKGVDEDFGRGARAYDHYLSGDVSVRPNPNLGAIETAPFYAVEIYPGDVGTFGGLLTDEHGRVLKSDGAVIPGLYATGNSTASVMGRSYPGAGASIGASLAFAWNASRHASGTNQGAGPVRDRP
jgi:3-oxosteroid 1-dehydrogenase